jgi:hypothetical protein
LEPLRNTTSEPRSNLKEMIMLNPKSAPRFKIGTTYKPIGRKHASVCTVVDIYTTTNLAGEIVRVNYVTSHEFCGQTVFEYDVGDTTIARGLLTAVTA